MGNKLFVGGLAWATTDAGLRAAFEEFGEVVDAKVITDRETGRSRGFGFVTFAGAEDAQQAIQRMDGAELDGRNIRVNEAQERSRGPRGGGRDGGGRRDFVREERRPSGNPGGGFGPPAFMDEGKPSGRKRHNGGGRRGGGGGGRRGGGRRGGDFDGDW